MDPNAPQAPAAYSGTSYNATDVKRTDVTVVSNSKKPVHVDVDGGNGWPRDPEEWKRLLAKAAPWLVGAALLAVGVNQYKKKTGVEGKARRGADRAAHAVDDAVDSVKHGWFGLKARTKEAVHQAGDKAHDAKVAAGKKAHDAKDSAREAAHVAKRNANEVAHNVKDNAKVAADKAADKTAEKSEDSFFMWKTATKGVREKYNNAKKEVADGARRAGNTAEGVASKGAAKAGVAEEKTGRAMQEAGKRIEQAGHDTRKKYGDVPVEAPKKKFLGIF
ncbi:hypothetical protein D9Q98_001402 [Chlorella vulgaris]|uniref:Late embryogenesis abundant protein n=1 Tax=Chlorella vulgaris TaxID=3077 RepID=A0A9D4U0P0_CHLVU|nr:hypothetical protein D9Q98_001402 [Chlorella vulgaris]